jgi:hypothetical protein
MIVRRIEIGPNQDVDKFVEFMREEYLPAIRRGPTRVGQAEYAELFQGNTETTTHQFILLVEGLMILPAGFVGEEQAKRFQEFVPKVDHIADDFRSVARWSESEGTTSEITPTI